MTSLARLVFVGTLTGMFLSSGVATAEVSLPADLFGLRQLADQIRSPISLKLRDMGKAYGTDAHSGNQVDLVDTKGKKVSGVIYVRSLNPEKTKRSEETRVYNDKDKLLITETIVTRGTELTFSDPAKRAYLDGSPEYELSAQENAKIVSLRFGSEETFRFITTRSADRGTLRSEVFYGGSLVLTISDKLMLNGTTRIVDYDTTGTPFRVGGLSSFTSSGTESSHHCRLIGVQSMLGPDLKMSCDGDPVYTYAAFSQKISDYVYTPLFIKSVQPMISGIVQHEFPSVKRVANLATGGKFYSDILNILSLLEPQRSDPNVLSAISKLRGYVLLIQDGTLEIKDNR